MQIDTLAEELDAVGLAKDQARVYIRLLQTGPTKVSQLTQFFESSRSTLYRLLDELAERGFVTKSLAHPTVYEAVRPGELFELKADKLDRSRRRLERIRERCEGHLRSLSRNNREDGADYQWRKIEGTTKIYRALHEMEESAEESIWSASNHETTFAGYLPDVEEAWRLAYRRADDDGIDVRLLFDLGDEPYRHVPDWASPTDGFNLRSLDVEETIHFVLVDERQLLMWVLPAPLGSIGKRDDVAIQTTAPGSVFAHSMLFQRLWDEAPLAERTLAGE